jgi:hypothetical protein
MPYARLSVLSRASTYSVSASAEPNNNQPDTSTIAFYIGPHPARHYIIPFSLLLTKIWLSLSNMGLWAK